VAKTSEEYQEEWDKRKLHQGRKEGAKQMLLALYKRELIEEAIYDTLVIEVDEDWRHFQTHWTDYDLESANDPL
jgi:hypothetical protein